MARWVEQAVRRRGWNLNPRAALSGLALVGALALLAAFYLALSSKTAVLGRHLQELEAQRAAIVRENAHLRDAIGRAASAQEMQRRALAAGFVTTGTVVFVPVALPDPAVEASPP